MSFEPDNSTPMLLRLPNGEATRFYQYLAAISVSLGAFAAGTVLSWSSPALAHILQYNLTNTSLDEMLPENYPGFTINEREAALVGSMLTVGALVSAIPVGYLADKLGRKVMILVLSVLFLANWILLCFSVSLEMVLVARFLAGMGLGGVCVVAPMYIGEVAEASLRGTFGSFFQLFLSSGVLYTCIAGYFTNWLGLAVALGVIPILLGGTFFFMPETPIYLVSKNNLKKAEKNLRFLRGSQYDIATELKNIQLEFSESQKRKASLSDILSRANLKATFAVVGVLAFQQFSGINAVNFYTVSIFKAAGTSFSPFLSAIIINVVQVLGSYVSTIVIEKANRKFFLMLSSVGLMICLVTLGMFFHLKYLQINLGKVGYLPLGSAILYMVCFSLGYGPVPWMLLSELFSPEIKGVATGLAILSNWIFAFIVTLLFPILTIDLGEHYTFYILAGIMALSTVFVYFFVPETRGRSLNQIQEKLNR